MLFQGQKLREMLSRTTNPIPFRNNTDATAGYYPAKRRSTSIWISSLGWQPSAIRFLRHVVQRYALQGGSQTTGA